MDYKKIEEKEFTIHIIKNKRFHTIDCRIYFTENVSKELITYRNALINVLTYATKNYDTKEKLIKKCQDLYSLTPIATSNRNGNLLTTKFGLSTINSRFIEKNNLLENILLLKEVILNPLAANNSFSEKYFNITKKELEMETKTIKEEPRLYANIKLLELIDESKKIVSGYSDLKILSKMNAKKLYQSYLDMLHNSKIDIFISGNITNVDEIVDFIKNNFSFKSNNYKLNSSEIKHEIKDILKTKKEIKKYQQSKLSIGYKFYNLTDYENRYVSFVYNTLLGGGANSLLMRYIREEKSLCYYINSYSNRMDNILIINSGINKENYNIVIKLIDEVLNNIKNGKFTIKDLEEAKMEVLYNLSNVFESNRSIIEYYYGQNIFNSQDIDTKIKMIKKISKDDIINFSKKIDISGIFFLKGDL